MDSVSIKKNVRRNRQTWMTLYAIKAVTSVARALNLRASDRCPDAISSFARALFFSRDLSHIS